MARLTVVVVMVMVMMMSAVGDDGDDDDYDDCCDYDDCGDDNTTQRDVRHAYICKRARWLCKHSLARGARAACAIDVSLV